MRNLFSLFILLLFASSVSAQYGPQYTHFMFNKMEYNPAYAGSSEVMTVSAIYRHQWQGIEGAPRTATVFGHMPFAKNRNGIGLSLTSDRIGMVNSMYAKMSYAYRMKFNKHNSLSFGLSGSLEHSRLDWSKTQLIDVIDNNLPIGTPSLSNMNFGVGVFYQTRKFYLGASAPYLLKNALYQNTVLGLRNIQKYRHFYFMGGVVLPLGGRVIFKPSALVSLVPNAPFEMDLNANFLFSNRIWIGGSYRLGDAISGLVQFQANRQLKIGVAYDYGLNELSQYNIGSFELMMEYKFDFENAKFNHLRYF